MKDLKLKKLLTFNEAYGLIKCLLLRENPLTECYFRQLLENIKQLQIASTTDSVSSGHSEEKQRLRKHHQSLVEAVLDSGICRYLRHGHELSQELLLDLCSLLEVDSFEIRAPDGMSMSGFYLQAALLAHNCLANTVINIDDRYAMRIYASCDIPQDTEITHCYVNVLLVSDTPLLEAIIASMLLSMRWIITLSHSYI